MKQLSLRARLLLGVSLVALVQAGVAVALISITSEQLLDQIDDRLEAAAASAPIGDAASWAEGNSWVGREGLGDVYVGAVRSDGTLDTLNSVANRGIESPPPEVGPSAITTSIGQPTTVEAQRGELEYRMVTVEAAAGDRLVLASPLRGYEWTINRLTRFVAIAAFVVMATLAAVTWWVLRLGITPVKQMTSAAEAIADGDLSERIADVQPGTEAGQLAIALNSMMTRIERSFDERAKAEERLRQFVADASHELRTPVATIRGYAELHQAGGLRDPAELDDAMRRTSQESERMSRLIADMLSLAKLDREPTIRDHPVDLVVLAEDVVADARTTYAGRVIELVTPPEAIVIAGDEDLLRQALTNLLSNAIVHTPESATTTVEISGARGRGKMIVADDGEGMCQDVVDRATERFFRADPSRSRHKGGSGLGLAIVASVAAAHNGDLRIVSSPGDGTTVEFVVPVERDQDHSQPAHR